MVTLLCPPRIGTARNDTRPTIGPYITHIANELGFEFHPWQEYLSEVSGELAPRGRVLDGQSSLRLNAQYVGCLVGRQSGKTLWCVARVVAQALMPSYPTLAASVGLERIMPQHIAYTAQSRNSAVHRWMEHVEIMEASPIAPFIKQVRLSNGREQMSFTNGSTYRPVTPNRNAARGMSLDLAIVDEALAHEDWLLSALRPTMAQRDGATGCIGAQFIVISNAGDDDSQLLNRMQELGHLAVNNPAARHVWMEWSAPDDCDPFDESVWLDTLPTLEQPNGITLDFLRTEAETLKQEQFLREYLCVRIPKSRDQLIPTERWMELIRNDVLIGTEIALGLDVTPDRQRATLMAASIEDAYLPLELVDAREGLEWVIPRVVEVATRWSAPVAIDVGGPAGVFIASLEALGVTVVPLATREVTSAAAMFYDAVLAKRICHMNDYRLNDAVTGASKRAVGDRWAFDRRGHADISPLCASSFAVWALETGQLDLPGIH